LLIKLESPGDTALFRQRRTGVNGKTFDMLKFRTMVPDAEELKKELAHLNELRWPDFKITNDPRITRMGRFLRKTSLDEVPQLLNVLRGEMSLVGPRPTSFSSDTYDLWHTERLDALPGITGLWQITGRGSMEFDERVRLDIAYIERRCLWLDIQILLRTVLVAFIQRKGAY
jgi:lipopolysaccharide/colanic/teichoic acid biosynthesis glycosyltransferase